jgi:hypothetical protein
MSLERLIELQFLYLVLGSPTQLLILTLGKDVYGLVFTQMRILNI